MLWFIKIWFILVEDLKDVKLIIDSYYGFIWIWVYCGVSWNTVCCIFFCYRWHDWEKTPEPLRQRRLFQTMIYWIVILLLEISSWSISLITNSKVRGLECWSCWSWYVCLLSILMRFEWKSDLTDVLLTPDGDHDQESGKSNTSPQPHVWLFVVSDVLYVGNSLWFGPSF